MITLVPVTLIGNADDAVPRVSWPSTIGALTIGFPIRLAAKTVATSPGAVGTPSVQLLGSCQSELPDRGGHVLMVCELPCEDT
ncbi:MAG: hypothetical protein CMJ58_11395 [Planctomycetaceae bacterium]|nr:hypothetical protein [Planctomycetaceae bacterium]